MRETRRAVSNGRMERAEHTVLPCPGGETGRRNGLKIRFSVRKVWVQVPPRAPKYLVYNQRVAISRFNLFQFLGDNRDMKCPVCGSSLSMAIVSPPVRKGHDGRVLTCSKCAYTRESSQEEFQKIRAEKNRKDIPKRADPLA